MAKLALLIGVSQYQPGLNSLPAAVNDIKAMQRVLLDAEMGGFSEAKLLENPERQKVESEIESLFSRCGREDLVLLFFSGHGIKDDRGRLYFAATNTAKNKKGELVRSSAVSARFVYDIMENSRCKRQAVILDCCFSGAFDPAFMSKDDGSVDLQNQLGSPGRVVLTSSSSTQYSFQQDNADLSIYTRYLVEGIETGAGDADEDGFVSADELHEYAASKVQETAPSMTPQIIVIKQKGYKLVLAKARLSDPKLTYRKEASRFATTGQIRPIGRSILKEKQKLLGLTDREAAEIEADLLSPFQERLANLEKYRAALTAELEHEYPLNTEVYAEMENYRNLLGLREEDILPIHQQVEAPREAQLKQVAEDTEIMMENLGNGETLELMLMPNGTFTMGSPSTEMERSDNESPQHSVTIPAFYLGKYPVTQGQWEAIMGSNPSSFKGANRPVEEVSWNDAVEFCQKLSQESGKDYRLPSEAEWEYACRAGTTTPFYFGETITPELANYNGTITYGSGPEGEFREQTTDVGNFPPNAFGLYDMHGNVWEWCQDNWHDNYEGAPTDGRAWTNENDDFRIIRGGSWYDYPRRCRSAPRYRYAPGNGSRVIGIRLALSAPRTLQ